MRIAAKRCVQMTGSEHANEEPNKSAPDKKRKLENGEELTDREEIIFKKDEAIAAYLRRKKDLKRSEEKVIEVYNLVNEKYKTIVQLRERQLGHDKTVLDLKQTII